MPSLPPLRDRLTRPRPSLFSRAARLLGRLLGVLLVCLLLAYFTLAFWGPPVIRNVLETQLSNQLRRPVEIARIVVEPVNMRLAVQGLIIREQDNQTFFAGFESFDVALDRAALLKGEIKTRYVDLVRPRARVENFGGGRFNFTDILPGQRLESYGEAAEPPESAPTAVVKAGMDATAPSASPSAAPPPVPSDKAVETTPEPVGGSETPYDGERPVLADPVPPNPFLDGAPALPAGPFLGGYVPAPPAARIPLAAGLKLVLEGLRVYDARFEYADTPNRQEHVLEKFTVLVRSLPEFTDFPALAQASDVSGVLNGSDFEIRGLAGGAGRINLKLVLDDLRIEPFLGLIPKLPGMALASGGVSFNMDASVELNPAPAPEFALAAPDSPPATQPGPGLKPRVNMIGEINLAELKVQDFRGQPLAGWGSLRVADVAFDMGTMDLAVGKVTLTKPELRVERDAQGGLPAVGAIQDEVKKQSEAASAERAKLPPPPPPGPANSGAPQLKAKLGEFLLEQGRIDLSDASVAQNNGGKPFALEVDLKRISVTQAAFPFGPETPPPSPTGPVGLAAEIATSLGTALVLSAEAMPDAASGKAELSGLAPAAYAAYLPRDLPMQWKSGAIGVSTDFRAENYMTPQPRARLSNLGVTVDDCLLAENGGPRQVRLPRLAVAGVDARWPELAAAVREVRLEKPAIVWQRDAGGNVLPGALAAKSSPDKKQPEGEKQEKPKAPAKPVRPVPKTAPKPAPKSAPDAKTGAAVEALPGLVLAAFNPDAAPPVVTVQNRPAGPEKPGAGAKSRQRQGQRQRQAKQEKARPAQPAHSAKPELPAPAKTTGPNVTLGKLDVVDGSLTFTDQAVPGGMVHVIPKLAVWLRDLDVSRSRAGEAGLSLEQDKGGQITLKGPVSWAPVATQMAVDIQRFDVTRYRPYAPPDAPVDMTAGSVNVKGAVRAEVPASGPMRLSVLADMDLERFLVETKQTRNPLLRAERFSVRELALAMDPELSVAIRLVRLADFEAGVRVLKGGTVELTSLGAGGGGEGQSVTVGGAAPEQAPARPEPAAPEPVKPEPTKASPPKVNIDRIEINGTVRFEDQNLSPPWKSTMNDLRGQITDFSLSGGKPADILFTGKQNNLSPLEIKGKVAPAPDNLFVDVSVLFKDVDLVQLTPYAVQALGSPIVSGKVSLDLKYLIRKTALDSKNTLILDRVSVGGRRPESKAPAWPINLLLAILEDSSGRVTLEIPVSGDLASPEFSFGGIIAGFLGDLVTKVLTSPLAFLGILGAGGQDAGTIAFPPGGATVEASAAETLAKVAEALAKKPRLSVEVAGFADAEADASALAMGAVARQADEIRAREQASLTGKALDLFRSDDPEAVRARTMRSAIRGEAKAQGKTPEEVEAALKAGAGVSEDDLRTLANQRATAVRDKLAALGVDSGRLFLIQPDGAVKAKAGNSKVTLTLR